jgi:hypothetical protein
MPDDPREEKIRRLIKQATKTKEPAGTSTKAAPNGPDHPKPPLELERQAPPSRALPQHDRLDELNHRYSVVNEAGKVWVFEWRLDPALGRQVLDRFSFADFRRLYENERIEVVLGKKIVSKSIADVWLASPARRQYLDGVIFDPTEKSPATYMNLWRGFAVEPKPGDWSLMRTHIELVICNGNAEHADYVFDWLARLFQEPNSAGEVALVVRGPKGCGKGIFGRWVTAAFGHHGLQIYNSVQLVGRFNEHLRDCVVLFGDEAFYAGDKQHEGVLKGLVTEPLIAIEGKYQRVVVVRNMLHLILASNAEWVIPATSDERRYCVFDVPDYHCGDLPYFADLVKEMESGGLAAMVYDLRRRDLSAFNVRVVPQTSGLTKQKTLSLDSAERWWLAVLARGFVWKSRYGAPYFQRWHEFYSTELLHRSYVQWCQENRPRDPKRREEIGRLLTKIYQSSRPRGEYPVYEVDAVDLRQTESHYTSDGLLVKGKPLDEIAIVMQERTPGYYLGNLDQARHQFTEKYTDLDKEWDAFG